MIEIKYNGDNLQFLEEVKKHIDCDGILFRASEYEELDRISKYSTDRGGFPIKKWENTDILYEDVIFATTETDIIEAEKDINRSSSFKKFDIIDNPILIFYKKEGFKKIEDRQWLFLDPKNKEKYLLKTIIHVIK